MKNKNSSNFTRDANWPPNHKTYFGFALPCLWNVIIHFLIWCGWLGSGQIGRFLTGIITFHRPGRAKCKKCFVVRESMCISGEIRGIFGFSKRNLLRNGVGNRLAISSKEFKLSKNQLVGMHGKKKY